MFKGFSQGPMFRGFPQLTFNSGLGQAYGFSNCAMWLDAAWGLNTLTDGANISLWTDRIKNIKWIQSTSSNQPIYRATDSNFNNLPSIDFNNAAKIMTSDVGCSFATNATFAFVYKINTLNGTANKFLSDGVNTNWVQAAAASGSTGFGFVTGATTMLNSVRDTSHHIGVISSAGFVYVDGVQVATGSMSLTTTFTAIGWNTTNTQHNPFARIAEILVFNSPLSASDCVSLSANLNAKYAFY